MSREKKFIKHIQKQDKEKNEELWGRIQSQLDYEETIAIPTKPKFYFKKWVAVSASLVIVLIVGIMISVSLLNNKDSIRYLYQDEYDYIETNLTIKDYSLANNKEWLYLDWYSTTDYIKDYQYVLKDTNELVCYYETILDPETGYVFSLYIIDNSIQMDIFEVFIQSCVNNLFINDIQINYVILSDKIYSYFTYENNVYYISTDMAVEESYFISVLEELIP